MQSKDRAESVALLQRGLALVPEPGVARGRLSCALAGVQYDQAVVVNQFNRRDMMAAMDECNRLLPGDAMAQLMGGIANVMTGQVRKGALLLMASAKTRPQLLDSVEIAQMQIVLRKLGYANETGLANAWRALLVQHGYGKDDPKFFGEMALDAIAGFVDAHSNSEATALLPQIMTPDYGLRMLIDRRFEPIWPMVEQWAGGDLKRQREAITAAASAQFRIDPSLVNRRILADALWSTGRRDEALTLLKQAIDDPKLWDEDRFYISLMTARYAKMLLFAGRAPEAIATASKVNAANPGDRYPYAVNLMPNFAQMLIQAGKYQDALDLIDREIPAAQNIEAPQALGYYAALRYCAYHRLGQERQAAGQSVLLETRFITNGPARSIRNACAVDANTVRGLWAARMLDPGQRSSVLLTFYRAKQGGQDARHARRNGRGRAAARQSAAPGRFREPGARASCQLPAGAAGMGPERGSAIPGNEALSGSKAVFPLA